VQGWMGEVVMLSFLQARCDAGCTAMLDGRWAIVERREGGGGGALLQRRSQTLSEVHSFCGRWSGSSMLLAALCLGQGSIFPCLYRKVS
jgi:hypothetical protein